MTDERETILEVQGLAKSFGDRRVLTDVNFHVKAGEVVVVMGPSGGGKSTLLRCLIGAERPDAGTIQLFDEKVDFDDAAALDRQRLKYGVLFQNGALFTSMTIAQNVALPIERHTKLPRETIDIMVKMKLSQVGLPHAADLLPSEISGGMVKRAALARAVALEPRLVFCDEPSAGLDPITVARIDELVRNLAKTLGIAMIVITHEMQSAFRIADRMVMLYEGKVIADGTPESMRSTDNALIRQFTQGLTTGPIQMPGTGKNLAAELMEDMEDRE